MTRKDLGVDPEYHRYRRSYPKFPGVQVCVDLLRRRNVHGAYLDGVLADLAAHAAAGGTAEIAAAFRSGLDEQVRVQLLSIIAEAPAPENLPLFVEALAGPDESVRRWAAAGLHRLKTPEAKRALWEARARTFADPAETARFHEMLDQVKQWK